MAPKSKKVKATVGKTGKGGVAKRTVVKIAANKTSSSARRGGKATLGKALLPIGPRTEYRIYPSIGIARIGNSTKGYFIGPETPGVAPDGPYRDETGIRPQAARFRIYKVTINHSGEEVIGEELNASDSVKIKWAVKLANRKAAASKIAGTNGTLGRGDGKSLRNEDFIREIPRKIGEPYEPLVIQAQDEISGGDIQTIKVLKGQIEFIRSDHTVPSVAVKDIKLAELRSESSGRLLVVGGPGQSACPISPQRRLDNFADNDGWYDSVSDGPVTATITIGSGSEIKAVPSWVVITVPRYAPEIYGIVTWYDQAVNMGYIASGERAPTSFKKHILPVLRRADLLSNVHGKSHGSEVNRPPLERESDPVSHALSSPDALTLLKQSKAARRQLFNRLVKPNSGAKKPIMIPGMFDNSEETRRLMPSLWNGANPNKTGPTWVYMALTSCQYEHFKDWVDNTDVYNDSEVGDAPQENPNLLTEAALEACAGGPFYPGIEGTYNIAQVESYHKDAKLRQEYRIDESRQPGFLTEMMALPWQADFADCREYWWPSQRPVGVKDKAGALVWWDRGVVLGSNGNEIHQNMVKHWPKLAHIVRNENGEFTESGREQIGDAD